MPAPPPYLYFLKLSVFWEFWGVVGLHRCNAAYSGASTAALARQADSRTGSRVRRGYEQDVRRSQYSALARRGYLQDICRVAGVLPDHAKSHQIANATGCRTSLGEDAFGWCWCGCLYVMQQRGASPGHRQHQGTLIQSNHSAHSHHSNNPKVMETVSQELQQRVS